MPRKIDRWDPLQPLAFSLQHSPFPPQKPACCTKHPPLTAPKQAAENPERLRLCRTKFRKAKLATAIGACAKCGVRILHLSLTPWLQPGATNCARPLAVSTALPCRIVGLTRRR